MKSWNLISQFWAKPNLLAILLGAQISGCSSPHGPAQNPLLAPPELAADRYNTAILVMDGVYNTELTAPFDVFQHTQFRDGIRPMNVFTVAAEKRPVRSFEGIRFLPDFGFSDAPRIDILVVPSAEHHLDSDLLDKKMIAFVEKTGKNAEFVMSLCDGAFVLARAGLLDGLQSTTFPDDIERMRGMFPKLQILEEVSFVHDGKCITSMGGARSFEAALYLCQRLYGKKIADQIAHGLVLNWDLEDTPNVSPELDEPQTGR